MPLVTWIELEPHGERGPILAGIINAIGAACNGRITQAGAALDIAEFLSARGVRFPTQATGTADPDATGQGAEDVPLGTSGDDLAWLAGNGQPSIESVTRVLVRSVRWDQPAYGQMRRAARRVVRLFELYADAGAASQQKKVEAYEAELDHLRSFYKTVFIHVGGMRTGCKGTAAEPHLTSFLDLLEHELERHKMIRELNGEGGRWEEKA